MDALNDYFCLILSLGARGNASLHLLRLLFSVKALGKLESFNRSL
ncbi:hypothetical protein [Microcoleus sp. FACHB-68]|nr:hypothetical protein [Microcoleus sp. FACHB-68]